jgi:glycosyltransferase involved in cell wall biosynthesis
MLKVLGPLLARLTGARAVHWAQDLYPEVAEGVGVIAEDGLPARVLRRLSTAALRGHAHVVTVGRCMRERLVRERGLDAEKVSVVPNWPPAAVASVPHDENPFRAEHGLEDRFVVMYSGNMGLAHPFDAVLDAAATLATERPEVLFLLVGAGPRKAELRRQVERRDLSTVRFLPFQPRERLAESLSAADLHLVTMRPALDGLVVPSKLYGALAAGRPALFLGPRGSEAARVVEEHDCGTVLPDPSGAALADAIRGWHEAPDRWTAAAERARAAVADARPDAAEQFDALLRTVNRG